MLKWLAMQVTQQSHSLHKSQLGLNILRHLCLDIVRATCPFYHKSKQQMHEPRVLALAPLVLIPGGILNIGNWALPFISRDSQFSPGFFSHAAQAHCEKERTLGRRRVKRLPKGQEQATSARVIANKEPCKRDAFLKGSQPRFQTQEVQIRFR